MNGHYQTGPVGPVGANRRHHHQTEITAHRMLNCRHSAVMSGDEKSSTANEFSAARIVGTTLSVCL
jgi:hypothetical protein